MDSQSEQKSRGSIKTSKIFGLEVEVAALFNLRANNHNLPSITDDTTLDCTNKKAYDGRRIIRR